MSGGPLVSIVLLNYNGRALSPHWESVFTETYPNKEIIFVDNGSTDGSADSFVALTRAYPTVRATVVSLSTNVGYSAGNNEGVKHARGEFICLLGNDVEVDGNWIRPVLDAFASDPSVGCVLPSMFRMADRTQPDRPWTGLDPFGFTQRLEASGETVQSVFFTEGTSMFFRRSLLDRVGYLFPPEYYVMHDDVDFCWRARLQGFSSVVTSRSRVFHVRGGTVPGVLLKLNPRPIQTGTRNRLASMYTNYSGVRFATFAPITVLLGLAIATTFRFRGLRCESRAVLRGLVGFLRDLPALRARRDAVQRTRRVPDRAILAAMASPLSTPGYLLRQWGEIRRGGRSG